MPYKHNERRRHRILKARYRVGNWRGVRCRAARPRQPDGVGDARGDRGVASGQDRPAGAVGPLFGPRDRDRRDAAAGIRPAMAANRGAVALGDDFAGSEPRCPRPHDPYVDGPGAAIRFHLLRPLRWLMWGKRGPRRLCDPVRCALMSGLLRGGCRWPSWVCACVPGTNLSRALEAQRRVRYCLDCFDRQPFPSRGATLPPDQPGLRPVSAALPGSVTQRLPSQPGDALAGGRPPCAPSPPRRCAPSCLPAPRSPAWQAGAPGHP